MTLPETSDLAGIVIAKDNDQLVKALRLAMESAMQDGSYIQVLKKYQADDGAVTPAELHSSGP